MLQTRVFQPNFSKEETEQWPIAGEAQDHYLTSRDDSKDGPFGVVWTAAPPCACPVWSRDTCAWAITYGCWGFCLGGLRELFVSAGGAGVSDHPRLTSEPTLVLELNWSPIS